jgi:hypothetical protein
MARHAKGFMPGRHTLGGFFSGVVYRPRVRGSVARGLTGYVPKHATPTASTAAQHGGGGGRSFFSRTAGR